MYSNKLSIKAYALKMLRENEEPFFYLAPDVVGSINNAYPAKKRKVFVIDFNTIDDHNMKLVVPHQTYKNYFDQNKQTALADGNSLVKNFLLKFLDGAEQCPEPANQEGVLGEMVDEFGDLYDDTDDLPKNVRGNPGMGNTKSTDTAAKQFEPKYTRFSGPMGYGGVTW